MENPPTLRNPRAEFLGHFGMFFLFPEVVGFFFGFFLPLGTPPSFESAGLEGYNPLIHKAQSIFFRRRFGEKKKKEKKLVPFCFSMIFLNKNIQRVSFMLITGMKQRVLKGFKGFSSPFPLPNPFFFNFLFCFEAVM